MIKTYWLKLNPVFRDHLLSAVQTFIATFLTVLGTSIALGHLDLSASFSSGLLLSAFRAAIKEAWAQILPHAFGGRKKA